MHRSGYDLRQLTSVESDYHSAHATGPKKFELGFAPEVIAHNDKAVAVLLAPADDDDLEGCCWPGRRASKACWHARGRASSRAKACRKRISGKRRENALKTVQKLCTCMNMV